VVQRVVLRVVTPCSLGSGYQRTGGTSCLHLQRRSNGSAYAAFTMAHLHPSYLHTYNRYSVFLSSIRIYSGITHCIGGDGGEGGGLVDVAQDRHKWRVLVNTVMNLRLPQMRGISWLAEELLTLELNSASWSCLLGWLVGWLVSQSVGWLVGQSVSRLVGWLISHLVA